MEYADQQEFLRRDEKLGQGIQAHNYKPVQGKSIDRVSTQSDEAKHSAIEKWWVRGLNLMIYFAILFENFLSNRWKIIHQFSSPSLFLKFFSCLFSLHIPFFSISRSKWPRTRAAMKEERKWTMSHNKSSERMTDKCKSRNIHRPSEFFEWTNKPLLCTSTRFTYIPFRQNRPKSPSRTHPPRVVRKKTQTTMNSDTITWMNKTWRDLFRG